MTQQHKNSLLATAIAKATQARPRRVCGLHEIARERDARLYGAMGVRHSSTTPNPRNTFVTPSTPQAQARRLVAVTDGDTVAIGFATITLPRREEYITLQINALRVPLRVRPAASDDDYNDTLAFGDTAIMLHELWQAIAANDIYLYRVI